MKVHFLFFFPLVLLTNFAGQTISKQSLEELDIHDPQEEHPLLPYVIWKLLIF